jgi:hypothetical protein
VLLSIDRIHVVGITFCAKFLPLVHEFRSFSCAYEQPNLQKCLDLVIERNNDFSQMGFLDVSRHKNSGSSGLKKVSSSARLCQQVE